MELDKERLAKLLSMTSSEHDAEALAAIRKANEHLRLHRKSWSEALGVEPVVEPPRSSGYRPEMSRPPPHPSAYPPAAPEPPPGYQRLRYYRDGLRHEPFLPRLLGFPYWLLIEIVAVVFPNAYINTRGTFIALVFALGMILGIATWIWLGYYLVFVA